MPIHKENRLMPYTAEQMFDLVADVDKYPAFLPWCTGSRIRSKEGNELIADLSIGFGPFRESFTSRVTLDRPHAIMVHYENGPFKYLNNQWTFEPDPRGCHAKFYVDFEFRSRMLQLAIGSVFGEAVRRMVGAFLKRAHDLYGAPIRRPAVTPVPARS